MKLSEIKIEALKLMFANGSENITEEKLVNYEQDEQYRGYLINMPGAINRCLSVIEERRVLPSKRFELDYPVAEGEPMPKGAFFSFELDTLITDFFDIDRLVRATDEGEYTPDCEYIREGDTLILGKYGKYDGICYTVMYKPKLTRITSAFGNQTQLNIPENIASLIPYFIKGELFRDDEPGEAGEAMNWFEQRLSEISHKREVKQSRVKTVFSQTEM